MATKSTSADDGCAVAIVGCLGVIILTAGFSALSAWVVMLLLGVLAIQTGWNCALGFWSVWIITFLVGLVGSRFHVTTSSSS